MTSAALSGLLIRRPFRPFTLHAGGDSLVYVSHPEQVLVRPGIRIIIIMGEEGWEQIIDLERVAMITVEPEKRS